MTSPGTGPGLGPSLLQLVDLGYLQLKGDIQREREREREKESYIKRERGTELNEDREWKV